MKTVFSAYVQKFYNLVTEIMKAPDNDRTPLKLDPVEVKESFSWYLKADLSNGADYQNPKGRYQGALRSLVAALKTTRPALAKRVMEGDLLPLRQYTEEVFAEPGAPAIPKDQQLYFLVNRMLAEEADPKNRRADQPLRLENPEKFRDINNFVQRYDQALKKLPSLSGVVFRGTALNLDDVQKIREQESGEGAETVILPLPTYTSTTLDIADGMEFLRVRAKTIFDGEMPTLMVIDGLGKLVSFAGQQFVREEEIVIPRNSKLQVLRSVTDNFAVLNLRRHALNCPKIHGIENERLFLDGP